jgi:DNA-directed RNA polymerase
MKTIHDQIEWEREALERGSERYYTQQDKLKSQGKGDQSHVVSYLLKDRLEEVAQKIEDLSKKNKGVGGNINKILRQAIVDKDYLKTAYIGTKLSFQMLLAKEKNTILKLCLRIGSSLEADLKCKIFKNAYPGYYEVVQKSFNEQNVSDYVHKHKVMMKKFGDFELTWNDWEPNIKTKIGAKVLQCVLAVFDDVLCIRQRWSRNKSVAYLDSTVHFDEWAAEFERERGFMEPILLPLKIPPMAWTGERGVGGYYHPQIRNRLPFIKTRGRDHRKFVDKHVPKAHMKAVNKIQRTGWKINKRVLEVQKLIYERDLQVGIPQSTALEVPLFPEHLDGKDKKTMTESEAEEFKAWKSLAKRVHQREQERKGKVIAFLQSYKLAQELQTWDEFYFVYTCDFRGRVYCATAGLSPQGADSAKGLLMFSKSVKLGREGIKWLAIHGANVYGQDKVSYQDRVNWVVQSEDDIRRVVEDPISSREYWGQADKPYQFLAFCFEWSAASYGRNPDYKSSIAVGLDGSCNGLQHFSAMLRDEVGAHATNLLPCPKPEDIYARVAEVTTDKLKLIDDPRARKWLHVGVNRKCAKRPVMTLPYGATQQSARQYILEYTRDNWTKFDMSEQHQWDMAKFLTPILWSAIGEVVVAARMAMNWLQKNTWEEYKKWVTPIGFPVYQYYKDAPTKQVKTELNGKLVLTVRDEEGEVFPKQSSQRSGVAPNFVHSIDSTHMVMTINSTDFSSYAMIHDDFGTHAGNTHILFRAIRKSFRELYTKHNPLQEWADQQEQVVNTLPDGKYDINEIMRADYFFG